MKVFTNRVLYGIREKRRAFLCKDYVGCNKKQINDCGNKHVDKVVFEYRNIPCFDVKKEEINNYYISLAQKHILQDWSGICDRLNGNIFVINNFPNEKFCELSLEAEELGVDIVPDERTSVCFVFLDTRNEMRGSVWIIDTDNGNKRIDILQCTQEGALSYSITSYQDDGEEDYEYIYKSKLGKDDDAEEEKSNESSASNIAVVNAMFILLNKCKNYGRVWKNGIGLTFSDYHSPIVNKTGLTLIAYDNE